MCFSAQASFAGGIIISSIGIFTVRKVHKPSQILFASIPLFFGLQQITEGVLWLTIPLAAYAGIQNVATNIFLVMALVLWPLMIPLSVLFMEEVKKRRKILFMLLIIGAVLSVYHIYRLFSYDVIPQIKGFHIEYYAYSPKSLALISFLFYLVITIVPLFVSSIKRTHLLGILMTLSCLITAIFFTRFLTSVWCFFAALISVVIFWILSDSRKKFNLDKLLLIKNPFKEAKL